MPLAPGTMLGPYQIVSPLGAGGMGEVYRAQDTRLNRAVAIKTVQERFSERFANEARTIAALNHPHICTLYDVGPDYLVMELVDGRPLQGPLPREEALRLASQICEALDAAHRQGIVHRDLKPSNILVTKSGVNVGSARGVHCDAGQVIITSGAQQALDLVARILLDPGDRVWLEDPGYPGARFTLRAVGAHLIPVPVDDEGLNVEAARKLAPRARMGYVTPANQFPLGITMPLDRRLELLNWAVSANALIIEDEYDAEYRYFGRPLAALQSLDRSGCVLYAGTFTKMLFNALRLGFLVLPERLVNAFEAARSFIDRHPPTLDQAILAEFILEGHFGHHVRRMRQTYAERMSVLREAALKHLGGLVDVKEAAAGMRTVAWLKTSIPETTVAQRARSLGLELSPLSDFTIRHSRPAALILGFAGCNASELHRGVRVLAAALDGVLTIT